MAGISECHARWPYRQVPAELLTGANQQKAGVALGLLLVLPISCC
jgi:hypothetical protein